MHKDCRTRKQLLAALRQAEATIHELIKEKQRHAALTDALQEVVSRNKSVSDKNGILKTETCCGPAVQNALPDGCRQPQTGLIRVRDILVKILDTVADPIFIKDSKHRIILANQAQRSLYDMTHEEILGRKASDLFSSTFAEFCRSMDELVLATGESQAFEGQIPDAEGQLRTWQTRKSPYVDPSGEKFIVCATRDITESKQAEEVLRKRLVTLTQPPDDSDVSFEALLDLEDLQRVQDSFSELAGVASLITTPDGTPITKPSNFCRLCNDIIRNTEKGRASCSHSDALIGKLSSNGPAIQPCLSGGLWDAGASITVDGKHVANWLVGQVRIEGHDESRLLEYAEVIGADRQEFAQALREVPVMSRERLEKIAQAMFLVANKLSLLAYQNLQQARLIHEREQREQRLRASLQEKESLLREVHHRVKNNLQIISSLLSLQSNKAIEQWAMDLFTESRDRISAMALVHEELYGSSDFSRISLKKYLEKIVPRLANPAGRKNGPICTLRVDAVELSIEKAVPFGLIINELVTNAVKHGLKGRPKGKLRVEVRADGGTLTVTVADNGCGLPPDFEPAKIGSLGMQLVLGLTRQLRGSFQTQNECGAVFVLTFPLD